MSFMLTETCEQPDWVERAIECERGNASRLAAAMHDRDIKFVIIAARGTSDNAATYAKYLFEITAGIPVSLAAPSVYTLYDAQVRIANMLVIGISQSGQGTDVVQVLSAARSGGALTACITNYEDLPACSSKRPCVSLPCGRREVCRCYQDLYAQPWQSSRRLWRCTRTGAIYWTASPTFPARTAGKHSRSRRSSPI